MTVKEMESRLNELEDEIWELSNQTDEESFCNGCEHIRIVKVVEVSRGLKVTRGMPCCDADFCPQDSACPRKAEYKELEGKLEKLNKEYERLSALYDMAEAKEYAEKNA